MYYIKALLLTELVECSLAAILSRDVRWVKYVFLINVVTNPAINLLYRGAYPLLTPPWHYVLLYALEAAVVLFEGCLIYLLRKSGGFKVRPLRLKNAFLYSLILNLASYCFGVFVLPLLRF